MPGHKTITFPKSRVATLDVCAVGLRKHHLAAMIEVDVTGAREKIRAYKKHKGTISFTAWLISVIARTIKEHETAAAFLKGKRKAVIFDDINVSVAVEKKIGGERVPIPLVIEKAQDRSIESITEQINEAREIELTGRDIVLKAKPRRGEQVYYLLPGFLRRLFWRQMLKHPRFAFSRMGNVAFTSIGMIGSIDGWFIPISVHPVCFGISSIIRKPAILEDHIQIREMLKLTVLIDHDVMDGAPVTRFIGALSENIKNGMGL
jgi:pyruvate/2-oxoglutarate dehydrogenase complex dihydrolipoamide acyltransferase (E2) component